MILTLLDRIISIFKNDPTKGTNGQIFRYFIVRNVKLGAIIKIFITRFGAIIKF